MDVKAYILVRIDAGHVIEVAEQFVKLSDVKKVTTTYGITDLILEVESATLEDLDNFVFNQIRKVSGVRETNTVIAARVLHST